MATVNEKMTAIADPIRTLMGVTGALGLDAMASNLNGANTEVADQTALIDQIIEALEGKAGNTEAKVSYGTITPAKAVAVGTDFSYSIEHGLGEIPTFFAIMASNSGRAANSLRSFMVFRGESYDYYSLNVEENSAGSWSGYFYGSSKKSILTDTKASIRGFDASTILQAYTYNWFAFSDGNYIEL